MKRALCLLFLILFAGSLQAERPTALYLTWKQKPDTTMTILWITDSKDKNDAIYFRRMGHEHWEKKSGKHSDMPLNKPYFIHQTELTGLKPNHTYEFRIGKEEDIYKFQTLPSHLNEDYSIRFIVGGDMYHGPRTLEVMESTSSVAAKLDPHFILIGGDIAYSASSNRYKRESFDRWMEWLQSWSKTMVRADGTIIPIIPAIGNHETNGRFNQTPTQALMFYALFPMPGEQGYNVLDFGNYMSIILLDSGHTHPIKGNQTDWLRETLKKRRDTPHKFALYHVPAYPSVGTGTDIISTDIRTNWVPLFDQYHLDTAFENHCHTYKRSHPLLNNAIDPDGVLYMGDGAWGVRETRIPKTPEELWYLARSAAVRHVLMVHVEKNRIVYQAVDQWGRVFDEYARE